MEKHDVRTVLTRYDHHRDHTAGRGQSYMSIESLSPFDSGLDGEFFAATHGTLELDTPLGEVFFESSFLILGKGPWFHTPPFARITLLQTF